MNNEELFKFVAANIKALRKDKGYTQESFAEYIDRTYSYVAKLESGKNNLTLSTLNLIATNLEISVAELFVAK